LPWIAACTHETPTAVLRPNAPRLRGWRARTRALASCIHDDAPLRSTAPSAGGARALAAPAFRRAPARLSLHRLRCCIRRLPDVACRRLLGGHRSAGQHQRARRRLRCRSPVNCCANRSWVSNIRKNISNRNGIPHRFSHFSTTATRQCAESPRIGPAASTRPWFRLLNTVSLCGQVPSIRCAMPSRKRSADHTSLAAMRAALRRDSWPSESEGTGDRFDRPGSAGFRHPEPRAILGMLYTEHVFGLAHRPADGFPHVFHGKPLQGHRVQDPHA